jgi:hypothetical protein
VWRKKILNVAFLVFALYVPAWPSLSWAPSQRRTWRSPARSSAHRRREEAGSSAPGRQRLNRMSSFYITIFLVRNVRTRQHLIKGRNLHTDSTETIKILARGPGGQSRQSSRLFLQSSELGPPLTLRWVCPPFWFRGGTLAYGGGGGGSQFGRGSRHCGTLGTYICTLWPVL